MQAGTTEWAQNDTSNGGMEVYPQYAIQSDDWYQNGTDVQVDMEATGSINVETAGAPAGNTVIGFSVTQTNTSTWSSPRNFNATGTGVSTVVGTGNLGGGAMPITWDIAGATGGISLTGNINISYVPGGTDKGYPVRGSHLPQLTRGWVLGSPRTETW